MGNDYVITVLTACMVQNKNIVYSYIMGKCYKKYDQKRSIVKV